MAADFASPARAIAGSVAIMVVLGWLCGTGSAIPALAVPMLLLLFMILALRVSYAYLALGALLPIYAVGPIPPSLFVLLRLALIGAIIVSDIIARRVQLYRMPNRRWWVYALALGLAASIHLSFTGAYLTVSVVLAALVGGRIASASQFYRLLFIGFRSGVVLSSLVLLGQASGVLVLTQVEQRLGHPGLSYRSTAFSYDAALALVLWYWSRLGAGSRQVRMRWVLEGTVVVGALLSSGGRGGLVAVLVAMVVLPLSAGRVKTAVRVVAVGIAGLGLISFLGLSTLSMDRLFPQAHDRRLAVVDQYGSGRRDILKTSIEKAGQNLVIGTGFDDASLTVFGSSGATSAEKARSVGSGQAAHLLLFALTIAGGLGLAAAAANVLVAAGVRAYLLLAGGSKAVWWVSAGIVIYLVNSLLEVGGGLVGVQGVLLFSCLVRLAGSTGGGTGRPRNVTARARSDFSSPVPGGDELSLC